MNAPPCSSKTVLVTGCSSGIGLAAARLLRERGWQVAPTARKAADLEMLRAEGFEPLELNLADSASIAAAADAMLARSGGALGGLVNNAGFGLTAAMEDCTRDMLRAVFETNVFGLQELTNLFVPVFRRQGCGRIINVSSVLGELSLPLAGAYSASKYAVEAVSDALRRELSGSGVAVSIVQPGPIATDFSRNLAKQAEQYPTDPAAPFAALYRRLMDTRRAGTAGRTAEAFIKPPEAVARKILHALESPRPKRRYRITAVAHAVAVVRRIVPAALIDAAMTAGLRRRMSRL